MGDQELSSEHVQICVDMSTKSWTIVNFRKPCDLTMVWFSPMHWIFSKVPRFKGTCESICFEDSQDSLIIAVGFISQAVGCTPLWNFVITKCRSCTFSHWTWWSNIHNYIIYIRPDLLACNEMFHHFHTLQTAILQKTPAILPANSGRDPGINDKLENKIALE